MKKLLIIINFLGVLKDASNILCEDCFERFATAMLKAGNEEVKKISEEHGFGQLPGEECSEGEALKNEINNLFK